MERAGGGRRPAEDLSPPRRLIRCSSWIPREAVLGRGWTLAVPDWKALPGGKRSRFTSLPT